MALKPTVDSGNLIFGDHSVTKLEFYLSLLVKLADFDGLHKMLNII